VSIKTIGQKTTSTSVGLEKKINDGAKKLVIDILQATQYSTPIPSTIRELVTNACDSQREKEIAIEILSGRANKEDYFITRNGDQYEDSNFDADYYNLEYLDTHNNDIEILYMENNSGVGYCDTVSITDHGVGIGGRRLEGMLELGYSTKRNTSENFGAFGLGSKVALSTGVPFYTVETHYNGKMFKLNCHPYKTDFTISKWDADGSIILSNGMPAYYKHTDEKNHTIISFGVKKHNRSLFSDSVSQQLTYFNNVQFLYQYADMESPYNKTAINKPLLNTETLIVCDGSYYSRPHIVIVKNPGDEIGINYGSIDFRELEMEQLWGNVGIKCPMRQAYEKDGEIIVVQEGVEVTPSREKVIWNDHTKAYVQLMLEKAANEASEIIEDELKQDEFVAWVKACSNVLYKGSRNVDEIANAPALAQISKLVDTSNIKPKFKDTGIRFESPRKMLTGIRLRTVQFRAGKAIREDCNDWTNVHFDRLYFTNGNAEAVKDAYLTADSYPIFLVSFNVTIDAKEEDVERAETLWELFTDSPLVKSYDEVEVPQDYINSFKENPIGTTEPHMLTPAEQRKLNAQIVMHTLRWGRLKNNWVWDKVEPKLHDVLTSETVTYYGTMKEDEVKLKAAATILGARTPRYGRIVSSLGYLDDYNNSPILYHDCAPTALGKYKEYLSNFKFNSPQIVGMSESILKQVSKNTTWKHIDDFFYSMDEDGNVVASEYLKAYLTSRILAKNVQYGWMESNVFKELFPEISKLYRDTLNYFRTCLNINRMSGEVSSYMLFLHQFTEYQDVCEQNDVSLRQEKSREIFVVDVPSIDAYDKELVRLYDTFNEMSEGINGFMHELYYNGSGLNHNFNTEAKSILTKILSMNGKFDIEVPEISVPGTSYGYEKLDAETN